MLKEIMEEEIAESKKEFEELEKLASDPEKMMEKLQERFENPERLNIRTARARERIREILTPEQRERLEKLGEEIPKKLAQLKDKQESETPKDEPWKPGADSWKPGDPIPEHLQAPEPRRRFPMGR